MPTLIKSLFSLSFNSNLKWFLKNVFFVSIFFYLILPSNSISKELPTPSAIISKLENLTDDDLIKAIEDLKKTEIEFLRCSEKKAIGVLQVARIKFESYNFCSESSVETEKNQALGYFRPCLCGGVHGLENASKGLVSLITATPSDILVHFILSNIPQKENQLERIWREIKEQEWIIPDIPKLSKAERTALHCETLGGILMGLATTKSLTLASAKLNQRFQAGKALINSESKYGKRLVVTERSKTDWYEKNNVIEISTPIGYEKSEVVATMYYEWEPVRQEVSIGYMGVTEKLDALKNNGFGTALMEKVLKIHPITKIISTSQLSLDNLKVYKNAINSGMTAENAIKQTPAFKIRSKFGFTEIQVIDISGGFIAKKP
jgi:hypothetical protein